MTCGYDRYFCGFSANLPFLAVTSEPFMLSPRFHIDLARYCQTDADFRIFLFSWHRNDLKEGVHFEIL
jgi:hypothetical protein